MMIIRTQLRHVRDAFRGIRRHRWMTFSAVLTVALTLLLAGTFSAFALNVNKIASDIEKNVTVKVLIDVAADPAQEKSIEVALKAMPEVKEVTKRTKEEELADLAKNYDMAGFEGDANPLSDVFIVATKSPKHVKTVTDKARKLAYVSEATSGEAQTDALLSLVDKVKKFGLGLVLVLVVIAILLISNTIKLAIFSRRNEIEIMRLVGAKNSYIRAPFLLEGAYIGLIGSLIPSALLAAGYYYIYHGGSSLLDSTQLQLFPPLPFLAYLLAGMTAIGLTIGIFGSGFSMRRFLNI